MPIELPAMPLEQQEAWQAVFDLRGVAYKPAERDHLASMLGRLANEPELMDQFPEAGEGVERLRLSLS